MKMNDELDSVYIYIVSRGLFCGLQVFSIGNEEHHCLSKKFHFSIYSRSHLGSIQPPIQWVQGAPYSGVKRSGRQTDHSSSTSAEIKKGKF
jgi:hypothetical protein